MTFCSIHHDFIFLYIKNIFMTYKYHFTMTYLDIAYYDFFSWLLLSLSEILQYVIFMTIIEKPCHDFFQRIFLLILYHLVIHGAGKYFNGI